MNGKYTFMGLLNSINSGNQPRKIEFNRDIYEWDQSIGEYVGRFGGRYLAEEVCESFYSMDMVKTWAFLTVDEPSIPILTSEEKTFLKRFIEVTPLKIVGVEKRSHTRTMNRLRLYDCDDIESDIVITKDCFEGLIIDRRYSLEELGLDDD